MSDNCCHLKMRFKSRHIAWGVGILGLVLLSGTLSLFSPDVQKPIIVKKHAVVNIGQSNLDFLQGDTVDEQSSDFEVVEDTNKSGDSKTIKSTGKERRHVALLKVHKTASSTAQNVFLRFGDSRKLNFVLPHTKGESGWPNVISYTHSLTSTNIVPAPKGERFDILCCHVLYNRKQFQRVLPADTAYIGIVREPVSRFQSAVKYFSPQYILKIQAQHPISVFLKNPLKHDHKDPKDSQTNNRMATEFGFPPELFPGKSLNGSVKEINKYLDKLDEEFELIIISERFDESMVLMRRLLNWSIKDVLYLDKNKGVEKPNPKKLLQESDEVPLRQFLYLDDALYNWSVQRFVRQIAAEGEDFQKEVEFFKEVKEKVKAFCKSSQKTMTVDESSWNKQFSMTRGDCLDFSMHEKDMILKQRKRMYGTEEN